MKSPNPFRTVKGHSRPSGWQLLIELDGGQHAESAGYDRRRDAYLQQQGFRVIRYWNHQVLRETDEVLEDIRRHLLDLA